MKDISRAAGAVHPSSTLAVDAMAKRLKAEGLDVIGFGAGEPDFDTPLNIREAAKAAIDGGVTRYTPAAGTAELRRAVAARFKADFGLDYDYTQITIASGAKHSVFIALVTLLDPGDEVILPAPYWVTYYEAILMAGGVPVVVSAPESAEFKLTPAQLRAAVTDKTKAIILNNPSNPTGMLYSREELRAIADVCTEADIYVVADEIYCGLVYDGAEFVSFPTLGEDVKERTILINGVSKSYAMTGWRIGYAAANAAISKAMGNYLSHSTGAPASMAQAAAVEALTGDQSGIAAMKDVFETRRNYIVERIAKLDSVSCLKPHGAFYIMMNIEKLIGRTLGGKLIQSGDDFAMALLERANVAVVPCSGFGAPNYVRWTYAASMEDIRRGMDRLEKFLAE